MKDLLNGNLLIVLILTMVISCSASRSITQTYIQGKPSVKVDTTLSKKLDSLPEAKLKPSELEIKSNIVKSVRDSNRPTSQDNTTVLNSIDEKLKVMVDMFNQAVSARIEKDSLAWENERNKRLLNQMQEHIQKLVEGRQEDAKIGRALQVQMATIPKYLLTILGTLFIVAGVMVWYQRKLKNDLIKCKNDAQCPNSI